VSGREFETRIAIANCGCGGRGIIWDRPSDYAAETGTVEAFCGKHCGIRVPPRGYRADDRPHRKIGLKVVRTWNRAMNRIGDRREDRTRV
jgi:hypothetical protein